MGNYLVLEEFIQIMNCMLVKYNQIKEMVLVKTFGLMEKYVKAFGKITK